MKMIDLGLLFRTMFGSAVGVSFAVLVFTLISIPMSIGPILFGFVGGTIIAYTIESLRDKCKK